MVLKYTTIEAITLRLSKRLQIGGAPQTFGKDVVDLELINLVAPQVEAKLEGELARLYNVPFSLGDANTAAIVASIVEKKILAEVLPVHIMSDSGSEGGLRKVMAKEAEAEMEAVRSGAIQLKGEKSPVSGLVGFSPLSNTTRVSQRRPPPPALLPPPGMPGRPGRAAAEDIQW
jgi:hypothetical protein